MNIKPTVRGNRPIEIPASEVARVTGFCMATIQRRCKAGRIKATRRANGHWWIPLTEVEKLKTGHI